MHDQKSWERCVKFHGHSYPGFAIGYRDCEAAGGREVITPENIHAVFHFETVIHEINGVPIVVPFSHHHKTHGKEPHTPTTMKGFGPEKYKCKKRSKTMDWLKSVIEYGVIGLLGALSVIAVAIAIERFRFFKGLCLEEFNNRRLLELALTRRLHLIATIGSNAPYVGLLGTVLGIMLIFYNMGQEGMVDSARIMTGLALSLKATAAGLLVAIPAVVLYNLLLRRAKELLLTWEAHHG
ncbi:MAG: TonB-system energizer ExbB [Desulfocapsaceae bacterium]|nr:TonB-system energizer ExbB [Desulfocapsaceae bacterium]